jgi:hypothetical protein
MKLLFLPALVFLVFPLHGELNEIVATVNGENIYRADLDFQIDAKTQSQSGDLPSPELAARQKARDQKGLAVLIDRAIAIQAFYREGGKIPETIIDEQSNTIIDQQFGGDRDAFARTLKERGVTLEKYRQEITENDIMGLLRTEHPDKAWFQAVRKAAQIRIYLR